MLDIPIPEGSRRVSYTSANEHVWYGTDGSVKGVYPLGSVLFATALQTSNFKLPTQRHTTTAHSTEKSVTVRLRRPHCRTSKLQMTNTPEKYFFSYFEFLKFWCIAAVVALTISQTRVPSFSSHTRFSTEDCREDQ
jgi:hypothetical protein